MDYEGSNLVVQGCALTVQGDHAFGELTVTNAGTTVIGGTNLCLLGLDTVGSSVTLAGGSALRVSGAVVLADASTLRVKCTNTEGQVGGAWQGKGGTIHAEDLWVSSDSVISGSEQGYAGGSKNEAPGQGPGGGWMPGPPVAAAQAAERFA